MYQPLFHNILISPIEDTSRTIALPDAALREPIRGIVTAVGAGDKQNKMMVKSGDIVLFRKGDGVEVKVKNEVKFVISQKNILLVEAL